MLQLSDEETILIDKVVEYLEPRNNEEALLVRERFRCLNNLGDAVSCFPSVRESQSVRGVQRTEAQLLEALCSFASSSHLLHTPARVVAARSYLVAKFQAFSFLHILAGDQKEFYLPLRQAILTIIHTLMTEEVYLSILIDPGYSVDLKYSLANDLIRLWDSGTDHRAVEHLPALDLLWTARDSSPPAFGTLKGTSELLRITIDMGKDWQEFLVAHTAVDDSRWALEEFLFGLSHEELNFVRQRLDELGIGAVGRDEITGILDLKPAYGMINSSDYRGIYNFYVDRRDAARFRQKIAAPGPSKALEEIYLKYRILQE
ncbi:MAG: hypothetical protein FWH12_04410 [Treponema sp.]|nr:hypothetical protein [Treponema sp.]